MAGYRPDRASLLEADSKRGRRRNMTKSSNSQSRRALVLQSLWRKSFHIFGASVFPVLAFFVSRELLLGLIGAAIAAFVAFEITRFASPQINRWVLVHLSVLLKEQEAWQPTASTYLLFSTLLVFLLFDKSIAVASLFFLAVGDPAAGIVGELLGQRKVFGKSLEGGLACLGACLIVGAFLTQTSLDTSAALIVVGATSAALVELLPIPVDDNFTIPLFSAGAMALAGLYF